MGTMVIDLPMKVSYHDEVSGLNFFKSFPEFLLKHLRNTVKSIYYRYIVRDFSVATLELIVGFMLMAFGGTYGTVRWYESVSGVSSATAGAVMLAGLPALVGIQMILAFISFDMASEPRRALHRALLSRQQGKALFQSE